MPRSKPKSNESAVPRLSSTIRLYAGLTEGSGPTTRDARGISGALINATWTRGAWGPELSFDSSPAGGVKFGAIPGSTSISIAALVRLDSVGTVRTILAKRTGVTPSWQFRVMPSVVLSLGCGTQSEDSTIVMPLGEYAAVGVTKTTGTPPTFFMMRSSGVTIHTPSSSLPFAESNHTVWLGSGGSSTDDPTLAWVGRIVGCSWMDGCLPESQMIAVLADLWNGHFSAIRPARLSRLLALSQPGAQSQSRRTLARWFPGLSRR